MNEQLKSFGKRIFSRGEREALRHIWTEFLISHYHRSGKRRISRNSWTRPTRLHLGCGPKKREGYLNVDLFPGGDTTLDLRRPLPFESNCCETIFSEHFFEHIDYPEPAYDLCRECFRVLKPGGVLRFSVPDTEWPLMDYVAGKQDDYFRICKSNQGGHPSYCSTPMEHINFHFRQRGQHLFAYDEVTMRKVLEAAGFCEVQRGKFDPSIDSPFREVGSLIIVARKPSQPSS